jgi:hypothetical protein
VDDSKDDEAASSILDRAGISGGSGSGGGGSGSGGSGSGGSGRGDSGRGGGDAAPPQSPVVAPVGSLEYKTYTKSSKHCVCPITGHFKVSVCVRGRESVCVCVYVYEWVLAGGVICILTFIPV